MTTVQQEPASPAAAPATTVSASSPDVSASSTPTAKPEKPARPPSLNQLAARITASGKAEAPPSVQSSTRPRLAAQLLRTGSQLSLASSSVSNADSTAVNPPTTRSVSPTNTVTTTTASSRASSPLSIVPTGGEALTTEKVEKLNVESDKKAPMGYKNIPSLDAITARMAMTRSLSIDGTLKPPEPETYEDPATPGIPQKVPEHPLQNKWTVYHDSKSRPSAPADTTHTHPAPADTGEYEAGLTVIGDFDTVESFCRYFNWLKPPSKIERNSNYHLFKSGIKPMWEDPANANGGKWVLTMKNSPQLLDRCWSWLAMGMVGEEFDDYGEDICGGVVSLRSKVDRIQLWIRAKDDVERVNGLGRKLVKLLDISEADGIGLEFQYNSEDRPPPNKFLSIHSSFPQSSFRSSFNPGVVSSPTSGPGETPTSAGPGGAFGGFGGAGAGWRAKRG